MAATAPVRAMKKLINAVEDVVPESLEGLGLAHADLVRIDAANNVVLRRTHPVRARSPCCPAAARATSRSTAASSAWACWTPPVPATCSRRRSPIRWRPRPAPSTAARGCSTSSRTTPVTS